MLVFFLPIALADEPVKTEVVAVQEESTVEQAVQMNEQLSEILVRLKEMKSTEDSNPLVASEPVKRVEGSPPNK